MNCILRCARLLLLLCVSSMAFGQSRSQGDTLESIGDLPTFSGVWEITTPGFGTGGESPALTQTYAAHRQAHEQAQWRGDIQDTPGANCVPPGMPAVMTLPYPIEFLLTPGKVTILIETYSQYRQIFTDGRAHPEDPDLTFNGHSIGHWEQDTLVVDSVGFTTDTRLGNFGVRHSDKMRIVERMQLTGRDTLRIETTIYDPEALTKPWSLTRDYARRADWTIAEYICQQNNRNFTTEDGKAGIDLENEIIE